MVTADEPLVDRASFNRRLVAIVTGIAYFGIGATLLWLLPDSKCDWACTVLFGLGGCYLTFLGARGRANDLNEFSAENLGGQLIAGLVLLLLSLLW